MAIDAQDVLIKVLDIPITSWRFKSEEDSVTHIGPVAQDFMASFGYGNSDKHITSTDADGVALAAIQGLNQKLTQELDQKQAEIDRLRDEKDSEIDKLREEKDSEIDRLEAENEAQNVRFASLEERLLAMEASMK